MTADDRSFELLGVVHLVRPAGAEVCDLEQLRVTLERVPARSLFHHSVGRLLRHPVTEELPPDDISNWVAGVVQDRQTAERMSYAADSATGSDELRAALIEVLGSVPEKMRTVHDAPPGGEFVFLTAESVPIPSGMVAEEPGGLIELLAESDASVWFYHLVEEPWALGEAAPLPQWLRRRGAGALADFLVQVARSGRPLEEVRRRVLRRWRLNRLGRQVAAASHSTEKERVEAGREAVSRLVRRIRPGDVP